MGDGTKPEGACEDQAQESSGLAGLTVSSPPLAPLLIGFERLQFRCPDRSMNVELSELLKLGDRGLVPLLLYGLILKLNDVDAVLREAFELANRQAEAAAHIQSGPALDLVKSVVEGLGSSLPEPGKLREMLSKVSGG